MLKQSEGQLSSGGAGSYQRLYHGGKLYAFQERGFSGQRRSYCDRKSRILLKDKKNQAGAAAGNAAAPFRILNNNFGLLILDEPSSSLDPIAEYKLTNILYSQANKTTTILIAHRLSMVRGEDCLYVFKVGEICECVADEGRMD